MTRPFPRPAIAVCLLLLLVIFVAGCQLSLDLFYDQHPTAIVDEGVEAPAEKVIT